LKKGGKQIAPRCGCEKPDTNGKFETAPIKQKNECVHPLNNAEQFEKCITISENASKKGATTEEVGAQ